MGAAKLGGAPSIRCRIPGAARTFCRSFGIAANSFTFVVGVPALSGDPSFCTAATSGIEPLLIGSALLDGPGPPITFFEPATSLVKQAFAHSSGLLSGNAAAAPALDTGLRATVGLLGGGPNAGGVSECTGTSIDRFLAGDADDGKAFTGSAIDDLSLGGEATSAAAAEVGWYVHCGKGGSGLTTDTGTSIRILREGCNSGSNSLPSTVALTKGFSEERTGDRNDALAGLDSSPTSSADGE